MKLEKPPFTLTQQKIIDVLSDGMPHPMYELIKCLPSHGVDHMTERKAVGVHVVAIRKLIRPLDQDIVCQVAKRCNHYRHIRLLVPHRAE